MTVGNTKPGRGYIYVEMTIHDPEGFKNTRRSPRRPCARRAAAMS